MLGLLVPFVGRPSPARRGLWIAAGVLALLLALSIVDHVGGFQVWDRIASWLEGLLLSWWRGSMT
jgi:hypothetical protein